MGPVRSLESALPDAARLFFRHRTLRPIQELALPVLVRGEAALLSSATASGKTEAVFAPLYQRHVTFRRSRTSVIYVAPTKALVNDIYERLLGYFGESSGEMIHRYTGDHHDFDGNVGGFAVLCTPEALDSLQLMRPETLSSIRAIICDELHLLHGTPRGQQLRAVIERIRLAADAPKDPRDAFQLIAMTATIQDGDAVAELWLGANARWLKHVENRPIELTTISIGDNEFATDVAELIRRSDRKKILVFCNRRNDAHRLALQLSNELAAERWPVFLHMGILARDERENVEAMMRREARAVCVATSTLEVGIDIGDIDLVILFDRPATISGFLQRIGRGNRRTDRSVVWGCVRGDEDKRYYEALQACASQGVMDEQHEYDRPSVQFQQVMSFAWAGVRRGALETTRTLSERLGAFVDEAVVRDMLGTGALKSVRGGLAPNDSWMDQGDARRLHSVIMGGSSLSLVDSSTGDLIGHLDGDTVPVGQIYAGTRVRTLHSRDDGALYAHSAAAPSEQIARLPASRGRSRGPSRQLMWMRARVEGQNPAKWDVGSSYVRTWGGEEYNRLLRVLLTRGAATGKLKSDAHGLTGEIHSLEVSPKKCLALVEAFGAGRKLPASLLAPFRDASAYFGSLSKEVQEIEILRSVPWDGCRKWLQECDD